MQWSAGGGGGGAEGGGRPGPSRAAAPVPGTALDTFPKRLVDNAERFGDRVAFREKEFGIWHEITWRQYLDHVRASALGLYALGLRRGDIIMIIGDNRPEQFYI